MVAYTRMQILRLLKIDFVRFCIVGGTGFVINFAILTVLHKIIGWPIYAAQFIGSETALFSNFLLHHHWTYKAHKVNKSWRRLLVEFHTTTWPAILGSTIMVSVGERAFHLSNFSALAVSSVIALIWNFVWSKYVIWRDMTAKDIEEVAK